MSGGILFGIFFASVCLTECQGITRLNENEKNLIGEEDRRGVDIKKDVDNNDQRKSETKKRGLWVIGQTNRHQYPSGYASSDIGEGYQGYQGHTGLGGYAGHAGAGGYDGGAGGYGGGAGLTGAGGYGITGTGYTYQHSPHGGYQPGPSFGHGYSHSGGGSNFGYGASAFGHSGGGVSYGHSGGGYEESGHEMSHGNDDYKKLALKKLLIPLAGLAILGAAAALSTNPVLLQLGTIQGRRRRSVEKGYQDVYPANPKVKPEFTN